MISAYAAPCFGACTIGATMGNCTMSIPFFDEQAPAVAAGTVPAAARPTAASYAASARDTRSSSTAMVRTVAKPTPAARPAPRPPTRPAGGPLVLRPVTSGGPRPMVATRGMSALPEGLTSLMPLLLLGGAAWYFLRGRGEGGPRRRTVTESF